MEAQPTNHELLEKIARERQAYKQSKKQQQRSVDATIESAPPPANAANRPKDISFKRNLLLPAKDVYPAPEHLAAVTVACTPADLDLPMPALAWTDARLPPQIFGSFYEKFKRTLGEPTPVQAYLWPAMLRGYDCLAVAPTGSGKTLSFALPLACHAQSRIRSNTASPISPTTCLVLAPTRELAIQINKAMKSFVRLFDLLPVVIHGGAGKEDTEGAVDDVAGANIIVATPGRCLDFIASKRINLNFVSLVCIDEADRMLEMGFKEDCERICAQVPSNRQLVLTTATWTAKSVKQSGTSDWLLNASKNVHITCNKIAGSDKMNLSHHKNKDAGEAAEASGEEQEDGRAITIPSTITQIVHVCAEHKKPRKLIRHIEKTHAAEAHQRAYGPMIVFCNKIKTVLFVYEFLAKQELRVVALHGSMAQEKRVRALEDFRAGKYCILVATDVAGRGLHIPNLKHVVNYDFPTSLAQYAHRVGRCGRKTGSNGSAFSFFTRNLAAMAIDLVAILEASEQEVDPNLKQLANERRDFPQQDEEEEQGKAEEEEEDSEGEQPFREDDLSEDALPSAKRVKQASDASDAEEEDSDFDAGSVVDDVMDSVGAVPLKRFEASKKKPNQVHRKEAAVEEAEQEDTRAKPSRGKEKHKRPRGVRGGKKNKKKDKSHF